jgi:hypothetical protein
MGDMNAEVGPNNEGLKQDMSIHGLGEMNENGEMFSNFYANHYLVIGGTILPHKKFHKITWMPPDHTTVNQIDHIAIDGTFRSSLTDVRNK